jgi:hypothetical protein
MAPAISGKSRSTVCIPCSLFSTVSFISCSFIVLKKIQTAGGEFCVRIRGLGFVHNGGLSRLFCMFFFVYFCGDSSATSVELWSLGLFL